jgi:hypothetical protein
MLTHCKNINVINKSTETQIKSLIAGLTQIVFQSLLHHVYYAQRRCIGLNKTYISVPT